MKTNNTNRIVEVEPSMILLEYEHQDYQVWKVAWYFFRVQSQLKIGRFLWTKLAFLRVGVWIRRIEIVFWCKKCKKNIFFAFATLAVQHRFRVYVHCKLPRSERDTARFAPWSCFCFCAFFSTIVVVITVESHSSLWSLFAVSRIFQLVKPNFHRCYLQATEGSPQGVHFSVPWFIWV